MLKRILLSLVSGTVASIGAAVAFIFLYSQYRFEVDEAYANIFVIIVGITVTIASFKVTKTKNTLAEDILLNKMKIAKAEQEKKLESLSQSK